MSFRRSIFNNAHIKIAAVIVGVFLWLFAKGEQEADRLLSIPLVLRNMPDGLTTVETIPANVDVVFEGDNKELVRLGLWGEPYTMVDMSGAQAGRTFQVSMSPANIMIPRDAKVQVVGVRDPRSLDLEIDTLSERRLRVYPRIEGSPAESYFILGESRSVPDSVTVYGPSRVLSDLAGVTSASASIEGRRNPVDVAKRVEFVGDWNLHAVPREVRVVVEIEGTRVVTLASVPGMLEHELSFADAAMEPETVELTLSGPEHLVVSLTPDDVLVRVDALGLYRGTHELVPEVTVPDGVEIIGVTPLRVTVTLQ